MTSPDHGQLADVGLDPTGVEGLIEAARCEVEDGPLPSCQLALARDGEVVLDVTLGEAHPGDCYVVFSCSKAVMAAAAWILLSDGRLGIDQPVVELIPEFGSLGKDAVTVRQLLVHTAGFPSAELEPADWTDSAVRRRRFAEWPLEWAPASRFEYHPTSAHWVLAELIVAVTGEDYRSWIRRELLDPLGFDGITLGATDGRLTEARTVVIVGEPPTAEELEIATGLSSELADLVAEPTTDDKILHNRPEIRAAGQPAGGAVSTAADFALFYQALLHDPAGMWDRDIHRLGTAEILCDFPDALRGVPANRTLGLMLAGDDGMSMMRGFGDNASPGAFGHDGAGGQLAFADPASGLSFCYLTDGHDRDLIREWGRAAGLASLAMACAVVG